MRDIPIIFSKAMVLALLREVSAPGTGKRMTRRLALGKPSKRKGSLQLVKSPWQKVQPGDRLWVRENIRPVELEPTGIDGVRYLADDKWRPIAATKASAEAFVRMAHYRGGHGLPISAIHMPRPVSRLTLTVTSVKIEPLNAISIADVIAEGIEPSFPIGAFPDLWDRLHGAGAWAANPQVVAMGFDVALSMAPMEFKAAA